MKRILWFLFDSRLQKDLAICHPMEIVAAQQSATIWSSPKRIMTDGKKIGEQESVITTLLTGSHYAGKELFASLCVKTLTWTTLVWLAPGELWKKHTERQKDVRGQLKGQKKIRLSLKQKAGLSISPHYICVLRVRDGEQNTFWACAMALLICYIHLHLRRHTDTSNILINAFIF